MGLTTVRPSTFSLYDQFDVFSTSCDHKNIFTMITEDYEQYSSPIRFQQILQNVFSSIHTSCVNFIKIAALLRVGSIQNKKYRSMKGTPPSCPISAICNASRVLVKKRKEQKAKEAEKICKQLQQAKKKTAADVKTKIN